MSDRDWLTWVEDNGIRLFLIALMALMLGSVLVAFAMDVWRLFTS